MSKPTLYLFIGYPGAGKTTTAKLIAAKTGAVHLWADNERHKLFGQPTHSKQESHELYERLNTEAAEILANGRSVVFDTNFNFYSDRQKLRDIASRHGADTLVVWMTTPVDVARDRAVCSDKERNGYMMSMSDEQFNDIVAKLEPPKEDEKIIKIDTAKLDQAEIVDILGL